MIPNTSWPFPEGPASLRLAAWEKEPDVIVSLHEDKLELDLLGGRLSCACAGRLAPWGHARPRVVRHQDGHHVSSRPRRGICTRCRRTHVLVPPAALPRRRDAVETVGAALLKAAAGHGHRVIADQLGLPPSTVRNWRRRFQRRAEHLRGQAVRALFALGGEIPDIEPRATPLADAVEALGLAASAAVRRLGWTGTSPWGIIAAISRGLLLAPLPGG
jgi:transposase-like protein